jgi:hypothetical protein
VMSVECGVLKRYIFGLPPLHASGTGLTLLVQDAPKEEVRRTAERRERSPHRWCMRGGDGGRRRRYVLVPFM